MKRHIKIVCIIIIILSLLFVTLSPLTVYAEKIQNTLDFEISATYHTIYVKVPEEQGYYVAALYTPEEGKFAALEMEHYTSESYIMEFGTFIESEAVFSGMYVGNEAVSLKPEKEYCVIFYKLDKDTFPAHVLAYGMKTIKTMSLPDDLKGGSDYLQNTVEVKAEAGYNSVSIYPVEADGYYVAALGTAESMKDIEKYLSLITVGGSHIIEGQAQFLTEKITVTAILDSFGNRTEIKPDTEYTVLVYRLDRGKLPANIISYGTATVKTLSEPLLILGDANLDGTVNVKDVTLIQKHLARIIRLTGNCLLTADVNGVHSVNIADATLVQKYIAGIDTGYAIGEAIKTQSES